MIFINFCTFCKLRGCSSIKGWLFKRGASVAAKLVKTAAKIIILIHAHENKSAAAKFGPKIGKFGAKLLCLKIGYTCAWK